MACAKKSLPTLRSPIAILLVVATWALPVAAQSARQLFERGNEAYHLGDYETAIDAWTRAYERDPRPAFQYNLSQAYERAGRLIEATTALEWYLDHTTEEDARRLEARSRLAAIRERIARTGVLVRTDADDAIVIVDGEERARTPRADAIPVSPGAHVIVVRRPGFEDYRLGVTVAAGTEVPVDPEFVPSPRSSTGHERPSHDEAPATSGSSRGRATLPWVLLGAGGAVVAAGAVVGGFALHQADQARYSDDAHSEKAHALGIACDVLIGVGASAAVAGLVAWLVAPERERAARRHSARVEFAPTVGATGFSLHAQARF